MQIPVRKTLPFFMLLASIASLGLELNPPQGWGYLIHLFSRVQRDPGQIQHLWPLLATLLWSMMFILPTSWGHGEEAVSIRGRTVSKGFIVKALIIAVLFGVSQPVMKSLVHHWATATHALVPVDEAALWVTVVGLLIYLSDLEIIPIPVRTSMPVLMMFVTGAGIIEELQKHQMTLFKQPGQQKSFLHQPWSELQPNLATTWTALAVPVAFLIWSGIAVAREKGMNKLLIPLLAAATGTAGMAVLTPHLPNWVNQGIGGPQFILNGGALLIYLLASI